MNFQFNRVEDAVNAAEALMLSWERYHQGDYAITLIGKITENETGKTLDRLVLKRFGRDNWNVSRRGEPVPLARFEISPACGVFLNIRDFP